MSEQKIWTSPSIKDFRVSDITAGTGGSSADAQTQTQADAS